MRSLRLALLVFGILPVTFAVACSSSSNAGDDTNGSDSGTSDSGSGSDSAANDGAPVDSGITITDDTTVTANENGGFTAAAPDGSTCQPIANSYTYVIGTKAFSWSICAAGDSGLYSAVTGSRTLTDGEATAYRAKLDAVKISTEKVACGSDLPSESLVITNSSGTTTLYDESENCLSTDHTYADGVGAVIAAAGDLAHE